jgi:putative two-component system hydrogenase maturation factor HypX/HoxX
VLRRIRAADGSPGVRTRLCGVPVSVFEAHRGSAAVGQPGCVVARRHGAVLVRTGDGAVWIGHARRIGPDGEGGVKLPAVTVLGAALGEVPEVLAPERREITYREAGDVGVLGFDFYNGAMSTVQCHRLAAALRHAATRDTDVLVLFGGDVFSNGIHLNIIEAAANPAVEAWRNINAIDDVCRELIGCPQLVVAAVGGNAGAGGVMLALGADRVLLRDGVVLNPHYRTMGLFGSEYWTYVLPRRIGRRAAEELTAQALPIGASEAVRIGLADEALAAREFEAAAIDVAARLASGADARAAKRAARDADERRRPLQAYRVEELAEMSKDIFDDRNGFAAARRAFVLKQSRNDTDTSPGWRRPPASTRLPGCAPEATPEVCARAAGPDRAVRDAAARVGGT